MRPVNLIPDDGRRARASEGRSNGAHVLLGVLGVALAMLAAYVLTSNDVNEAKSQAASARQQADRLEAEAAERGSFTSFAEIKAQRLVSVASTAQTRFDWERLMREVSLVMPEGAWLQTTDASVLGDAEATVADPAAATGAPSPSATFVGCTGQQSEVATMMTRLRQMHRVVDVELNESTQEQTGGDVSFESCGPLYKFDVTVSFEPTAPAKEAPRGADRVPASLGGGS